MLRESSDPMDARPEIKSLTSLRGLAALWVLLHHITTIEGTKAPIGPGNVFAGLLDNGWFGVDIFFLLSGFVLTMVYRHRVETLGNFYIRRFARIYPLYIASILLLLVMMLVSSQLGVTLNHPELYTGKSLFFSILMVQPLFFRAPPWNFVSWSLSFEAVFYLIFPFLIRALRGKSPRFLFPCFAGLLSVHVLAGYLYGNPTSELPALVRSFAAFSCGMLGMFITAERKPPAYLAGLSFLALVLLAGFSAPAVCLIPPAALLVLALPEAGGLTDRALSTPVLVRLGTISYSIYLLQIPVYYLFNRLWPAMLAANPAGKGGMILVYCLLVIASAELSYRLIETPSRRWITARFRR